MRQFAGRTRARRLAAYHPPKPPPTTRTWAACAFCVVIQRFMPCGAIGGACALEALVRVQFCARLHERTKASGGAADLECNVRFTLCSHPFDFWRPTVRHAEIFFSHAASAAHDCRGSRSDVRRTSSVGTVRQRQPGRNDSRCVGSAGCRCGGEGDQRGHRQHGSVVTEWGLGSTRCHSCASARIR